MIFSFAKLSFLLGFTIFAMIKEKIEEFRHYKEGKIPDWTFWAGSYWGHYIMTIIIIFIFGVLFWAYGLLSEVVVLFVILIFLAVDQERLAALVRRIEQLE